jgi:hypothetical protein
MTTSTIRRTLSVLITSFVASTLPVSASAADTAVPDELVGQRIRITTRPDPTTGNLRQLDGQLHAIEGTNLVIEQAKSRTRVPLTSVQRVSVYKGSKRATKTGFWTGATVLGLVGGTLGLVVAVYGCEGKDGCVIGTTLGSTVVAGAVGGGVGAAIGSQLDVAVWKPIDTQRGSTGLSLQPMRDGVRASFTVRF